MRSFLPIVTLAGVMTGLNAVKPLHVDDATFYFNAAQIAAHPLDPYGYVMLRWSDAVPALHALAPPGLPYWWAAAIRMFGDRPVLWKLWLFPIALIFVASLAALLRRFAPDVAAPLLVLLVFSPIFLPSLNLMMDIPAQALSLLSLVLFFRACDRDSLGLAALAGLTVGMAMQTKYTAIDTPAVMLAYAVLQKKARLGLAASLAACLVFTAWETALFLRYGESHFVYQLFHGENGEQPKYVLLASLFPLLGGSVPTLALLALTVLAARRWMLQLTPVILLCPFLLLLCPDMLSLNGHVYALADALFASNGAIVMLSLGWAAWRLVRPSRSLGCPKHQPKPIAWFLVTWMALELVGYVLISPFPAVRRIMGTTIAATLLIGCLANQSPLTAWQRHMLHVLSVVTVLFGVGFSAVDYLEARTEQQAAYTAVQWIHQEHPQADIWYAGYWGFQYYAQDYGMKQIVPLRNEEGESPALLPPSRLRRGDWLVIPDKNIPQQELELDRPELEPTGEMAFDDAVPLATLMNYYAGSVPIRHQSGPRMGLRLFRVKDDFMSRLYPKRGGGITLHVHPPATSPVVSPRLRHSAPGFRRWD